jgi:protein SCO1/2
MNKPPTKPTARAGNGAALLKLAAVLLLGVAAGAAMFVVTLRSTPGRATAISTAVSVANLQGLLDQQGTRFDPTALKGRYALVYFGFTLCPDACPMALYNLTLALAQLDPDARRIRPIFVSVDPARDTPAQLSEYLAHFSQYIIGLTGSLQAVQIVEQNFDVIAVEHRDASLPGGYTMDHSNEFLLFSPTGKLLMRLPADQGVDALLEQLRGLTKAEVV